MDEKIQAHYPTTEWWRLPLWHLTLTQCICVPNSLWCIVLEASIILALFLPFYRSIPIIGPYLTWNISFCSKFPDSSPTIFLVCFTGHVLCGANVGPSKNFLLIQWIHCHESKGLGVGPVPYIHTISSWLLWDSSVNRIHDEWYNHPNVVFI